MIRAPREPSQAVDPFDSLDPLDSLFMFLGHYGAALVSQRAAPGVSLGVLFAAVVAWSALAAWLLPLWAWWADKHRDRIGVEAADVRR